jgi:hypothetical protein
MTVGANTYGRQVVESLVNKSGGAVAAGDVVVIDTGNDTAFTTTTTARSEVTLGIAQETIASNATGRVLLSGFAALVNVPASVTRGHYVETHTVAKQATGNSTRRSGSFGQFRTGGTTPTAVLWGSSDQTAGGGGSAGTAILLDYALASDITALSVTASTWTDIIANQTFTPASASSIIEIVVRASAFMNSVAATARISTRLVIDSGGTPQNKLWGSAQAVEAASGRPNPFGGAGSLFLSGLSAAAHTVKPQILCSASNSGFFCRASGSPDEEFLFIQVIEHKN